MDRADFKLGFLLAYVLAFALHAGLAYAIQSRRPRALEIRIFAGANAMLAGWHLLQWVATCRWRRSTCSTTSTVTVSAADIPPPCGEDRLDCTAKKSERFLRSIQGTDHFPDI